MRQPITDENWFAHQAKIMAEHPFTKPIVSAESGRIMNASIMGKWLMAHPGCTMADIEAAFTKAEIERFLPAARDYALRHCGELH